MPDVLEQLHEMRSKSLEQWTDGRVVERWWIDIHLWFFMHLYADLANLELELRGWSVRESEHDTLMVLRVSQAGTPYVVFITSRDATHCMGKLKKFMRAGELKLVPDRFA